MENVHVAIKKHQSLSTRIVLSGNNILAFDRVYIIQKIPDFIYGAWVNWMIFGFRSFATRTEQNGT